MRPEQWQEFKSVAKGRASGRVPVALIVDSPWIPGYLGLSHLDYYFHPDVWFQANLAIQREFPEVIFLPSWWLEYGMAIEASALGCRIQWWPDRTPSEVPMLARLEDLERLPPVNPQADGFMALALDGYRRQKQRVFDAGYTIPLATARGPLCSAAFFRGLTRLMTDITDDPEGTRRLLDYTTEATIAWLRAQAEVIGPSVEGIFLLDDIAGMLSRRLYLEFAHPCFQRITEAFPPEWVKIYHNDAKVRPFLADLPEAGFDVLNWTHNLDALEAIEKTGGRMRLMGNLAPLELGVRGSPETVRAAALDLLQRTGGRGLILSFGGGVSPGTPKENIQALVEAARYFSGGSRHGLPER